MRLISILILLIVSVQSGRAQWQADFYFNQAYESNPFRLPENEPSWISTLDMGLQYNFGDFAVSYRGDYTYFTNFLDRNHYWHQAAFFGEIGPTNMGLYYTQRFNKNDFTIYNYYTGVAYLNHSAELAGFNVFISGNAILTRYAELADLDNIEMNGLLRINKGFETRTTFISGLGIYYKDYTQSYTIIDTVANSSSGQMGEGMGSGSGSTGYYYTELEAPSVSQWQAWIRVAQSIFERTGLSAQYQVRKSLTGSARFVSGPTLGYNEESEIFDDPLGYELQSFGSELTSILPGQVILKASYYQGQKDYITQGIYLSEDIYDEKVLRHDRYNTVAVNLRKVFPAGSVNYEIRFWYQWYRNTSNSYWYNYQNHYSSISLGINF